LVELAGAQASHKTVDKSIGALAAALGHAREVGEQILDVALLDEVLTVSGEPLRAGRAAYAAADGMAQLLVEQGVSRVQFDTGVAHEEIDALYRACTRAVRGEFEEGLANARIDGIKIEAIDVTWSPVRHRAARGGLERYAAALVALRSYYVGVAEQAPAELRWVRRIAHRLVDEVLGSEQTARAMLTMAHTHRDPAARAVHTALVALTAAKRVTQDREVLARVALAALLRNAVQMGEGPANLAERPARLAALCCSVGGACAEAVAGVVAAFGAVWLDHETALGKMPGGALLTSRLVHQVGRLVDSLSHEAVARTPAEALRALLEEPERDEEVLCLAVAAVGALPVGSVVELDNGAWGVVVEPGLNPESLDRPTVRLLTTTAGRSVDRPARAELGRRGSGGPQRAIRLVPSPFTRFNVAQPLLEV
jgi:hypothetical protein